MSEDYSLAEFMVVQTAREIAGSGTAFVGMGLPMLAATLTKLLHDPDIIFCTEVGAGDWDPPAGDIDHAPTNVGDPILNRGAGYAGDMVDALGAWLMGGRLRTAVLTAAQIDKFGNLNALMIGGDHTNPDKRLPGTGGNTDAACLAPRLVTMLSLEPRRFVEKISFRTSPVYIDGPGGRDAAGLAPQGPNVVVSTMGVFTFDTPDGGLSGSCEMQLAKTFPGFDADVVETLIPWDLRVVENLEECERPTSEEIELVRRLDPGPVYLREGRY